uniref:Uncharacterized protein n=1 Tax=Oryza nivara TaxID=4536 RepID=A0A0E0I2D3_ORYNI
MAKNRNKKSKKCGGGGVAAMDTSEGAPAASTAVGAPERNLALPFLPFPRVFSGFWVSHLSFLVIAAMDTSEGKQTSSVSVALTSINKKTEDIPVLKCLDPKQTAQFFVSRKIKKGVQIKRSQNVRKMKAVARAISKNEKAEEKVLKAKSKKSRVQSAKSLYD